MKQTTLFKISKIAKFVPELLLCLAQFHPSTMKLSTSISILPKLAQLLPFIMTLEFQLISHHHPITLEFQLLL